MAVGEASKVSKVIYQIDDGETQTILDDSATIQVPESFCDGKVHKITVNAFYQDGLGVDDKKIAESVPEVYYFKYVE